MPEPRGGGDLDLDENWHGPERTLEHNISPGPMPEDYPAIARRTIGRWAGGRIALVGDYAEWSDLVPDDHAELIYDLCTTEEERQEEVACLAKQIGEAQEKDLYTHEQTIQEWKEKLDCLAEAPLYKDISDDVCAVIEHELRGEFQGEGLRDFVRAD